MGENWYQDHRYLPLPRLSLPGSSKVSCVHPPLNVYWVPWLVLVTEQPPPPHPLYPWNKNSCLSGDLNSSDKGNKVSRVDSMFEDFKFRYGKNKCRVINVNPTGVPEKGEKGRELSF